MGGLLDHIRSVNGQRERERKLPTGEFEAPDGVVYTYEYDHKVERAGGDRRKDETNTEYFIPWRLLPEFDYFDEHTKDNAEFWKWMHEFLDEHKISPISRGRAAVNASDYGFDWKNQKKPKYYSDWWGGSTYYGGGGSYYGGSASDALARRFSIALQAVQSTVRVIDSHTRRLVVKLSDTDSKQRQENNGGFLPTSMTDFTNRTIYVSATALNDEKIEEGHRIDVTTGFALHEASHAQYTEDRLKILRQPTSLAPLSVASHVFNIAEDARIEAATTKEFPGFAGYFERTLEYMWDGFMEPHVEKFGKQWGPSLQEKLNAIVAICRWPEKFEPLADKNPELRAEFDWWRAWGDSYLAGTVSPRQSLVDAMKRLAEDEKTKQEMEKLAQAEAAAGLDKLSLEEALGAAREIMQQNGIQPSSACSSLSNPMGHAHGLDGKKGSIGNDVSQQVNKFVQEELENVTKEMRQFPSSKSQPHNITILHPQETDRSRSMYKKPNPSFISRMRNAFLTRPTAMEWTERLLKTGAVDDDELWRAGTGHDRRFFEQRRIESAPDAQIALLIDQSGSMSGGKLQSAMDAAAVIHACVKDMYGTRIYVYSHTADTPDSGGGSVVIYRVWESGEPLSRMGIPQALPHGNNWDGYAIGWVAQEMLKNSRSEEQRILIVLSDGYPNGSGSPSYGGELAMDHMREVGRWAEKNGVDIIQIAVDPSLRPEDQSRMFKHWLPFEGMEKLSGQILKILQKLL